MTELWTDGSCNYADRIGGYGFVIVKDGNILYKGSGSESDTTNNEMERKAVLCGMEKIKELSISDEIKIYTDSMCVLYWIRHAIRHIKESNTEETLFGEIETNSYDRQQVQVKDFCYCFEDVKNSLSFYWCRGHSGLKYNEMCDVLADTARRSAGGAEEDYASQYKSYNKEQEIREFLCVN